MDHKMEHLKLKSSQIFWGSNGLAYKKTSTYFHWFRFVLHVSKKGLHLVGMFMIVKNLTCQSAKIYAYNSF